ncbi:gliding motility-associated ABC transporter ATP-binding subunit GldA [Sediminibacterium ginsengisoli]|uniref:Protein involved in gliding motility GldA n=1 Tax=Sediminibacterium ginsengisoli TaxID=413434 RepID=A0A1T4NMI6_9BACT|nr:gliding motility-associated ABC transporter ATP-binding subunit GldA [Sediminibacterium ginsengisoli]SJZ79968.1 protein involved in gliding motility GldA [Sediminibacterium ginsengisoli]
MSIEVKGLAKQYGDQKAVDHISFTAAKGEIVGFLGPNGAGKSTTMKMITGYLKPDAGTAVVNGVDVTADPISVKRKIGYLPEANPLYMDMYVREYLDFIAGVHQIGNRMEQREKIIQLTGLDKESHKKIGQLSKGYKQRVGLAAALIHDPEVLILDEPTSGLDPNQIIEIRNVIKEQGRTRTILFSSHILQEVEAICDRVIIISKGRIVADDTVANLRSKRREQHIVLVSFKEAIQPEWLTALADAGKVEYREPVYRILAKNPDQLRKQLLELAVTQNLNILSLQAETESLEDVFRSFTK